MPYFVGLDVAKRSTSICVLGELRAIVEELPAVPLACAPVARQASRWKPRFALGKGATGCGSQTRPGAGQALSRPAGSTQADRSIGATVSKFSELKSARNDLARREDISDHHAGQRKIAVHAWVGWNDHIHVLVVQLQRVD